MHVVKEAAAASLAGWTLEKIDMFLQRDESCTTGERLNTNLAAAHEQSSGQAALQSALIDAQDESSRYQAWWRLACKQAEATERHIAQIAQ